MDEKYRLVFRGELLEGQHRAVVKRRLGELMQLDETRLAKLFSGDPVVVKRSVDKPTAAKYQELFRQAGGRLRILAEAPAAGSEAPAFSVETNYLPPPGEPAPEIEAPDFGVAEVGAALLEQVEKTPVVVPEPDFDLAEVGADLLTEPREAPAVDLGPLDFEIAEVGADLGILRKREPDPAPDISHLSLLEP